MLAAIKLDNELLLKADKIDNVGANWLPAKFEPGKAAFAKR